jgi:hypothetical protein
MQDFCGWKHDPGEVERLRPLFSQFFAPSPDQTKQVLLYDIFRKAIGRDLDQGPQLIGDCVSWGWKHAIDVLQVVEGVINAFGKSTDTEAALGKLRLEYEETATEPIYALSRVEIGGQRGSYEDGSVGAWAAEAVKRFGNLSRPHLKRLGLNPNYDPQRAKQWGANGLPDNLEPHAFKQTVADCTPVRNFEEAAWHIQNGRGVVVCSSVGFENGPNGGTLRDGQGFARPRGTWMHCMYFCGVRWDRPGLALLNQWPKGTVQGPNALDLPDQAWWVDAEVVTAMLRQNDSYAPSQYKGYPAQIIDTNWEF